MQDTWLSHYFPLPPYKTLHTHTHRRITPGLLFEQIKKGSSGVTWLFLVISAGYLAMSYYSLSSKANSISPALHTSHPGLMTSNAVALFFHHFFLGQKNGQNAENFWIISKWQPTLPHGNTQCCWQKVNKATKTWPSLSRNRWIDLSLWSGVLKPGKLLIFSFAFASARPMHEYGQSMVIIGHYHHRRWWEKVKRVLKLLRGKLSARPPARFSLSQWLLNQPQSLLSSPGRILLCTHHGGFIHFTVKAFNWGFAKRFDAFNSFAQFGMELLRFSVNHQLAYFHPYDMNRLQFNRQIFWGPSFLNASPTLSPIWMASKLTCCTQPEFQQFNWSSSHFYCPSIVLS